VLPFDNCEIDACNHCIPQFYGMGGIDIGWTDYLVMLIHEPMMLEPNLVPGSGMRHRKSIIVLPFDNYETDACNHCIPQFYGMRGMDIGWTDYLVMLIHEPMMPEPNLVPGSGIRHRKSLIVLPFDNYETDACNHCILQFYGMGGIDIGWTDYFVMLIHGPMKSHTW